MAPPARTRAASRLPRRRPGAGQGGLPDGEIDRLLAGGGERVEVGIAGDVPGRFQAVSGRVIHFLLATIPGTCSDGVMPASMPLVQLALDFPTVDEALRLAEVGVRAGVDILEAGTPLIVAQGADCIGKLAQAFPSYPILADYKTMDSGGKNVLLTRRQGGHYMTVCANAADETVKAAIAAGKETGIKVVTDMIGVKDIRSEEHTS